MTTLKLKPEELAKLRELAQVWRGDEYVFLGFSLNLKTSELRDRLYGEVDVNEAGAGVLTVLLSHYAQAKPSPRTGRLIKFKDLPGGNAYEGAFVRRAIDPVANAYGDSPETLIEAAEVLGGKQLELGDAAAEVPALEGLSIVYIVWGADEFPASATVLFDESASSYLPTEDLAVLGEITTYRLIQTHEGLTNQE